MDYLIGNVNLNFIKELCENTHFNTQKDTITFYNDSIKDICLSLSGKVTNYTLRGYFQDITNDDILLCKKYKIKLSIIIEKFTKKEIDNFLLLNSNDVIFECVLVDRLLEDAETRKYIANTIKDNHIHVRILNDTLSANKYFNILRLFQEELFECGSNHCSS